jgi:hypothetical protein
VVLRHSAGQLVSIVAPRYKSSMLEWSRSGPSPWVVGLVASLVASNCGYQSSYVPLADGRARPVWKNNDVVMDLGTTAVGEACFDELLAWSGSDRLRLVGGDVKRPPRPRRLGELAPAVGFWAPVYFGAALVAPAPGVAPLLPRPALFAPAVVVAAPPVPGAAPPVGRDFDLDKAGAILAVIALLVLPIVDVSLAAAPPETDRSSDAIDQVNVLNDLARSAGTPCTYGTFQ